MNGEVKTSDTAAGTAQYSTLIRYRGYAKVTPVVYEHGVDTVIPRWQGWAREARRKLEEADRGIRQEEEAA